MSCLPARSGWRPGNSPARKQAQGNDLKYALQKYQHYLLRGFVPRHY